MFPAMARRKKGPPKSLKVLFGRDKVRSLAKTIMDLIPTKCHCITQTDSQSKCLHCWLDLHKLLRPGDPPDYLFLLNQTFVFIPKHSPPLPPETFYYSRRTQFEILKRSVQEFSSELPDPITTNVISECLGSDKFKDWSPSADLLNTSASNLLLERIGEELMFHLLWHTSIFLLCPEGRWNQVTGLPAGHLFTKWLFSGSEKDSRGKKKAERVRPPSRTRNMYTGVKREEHVKFEEHVKCEEHVKFEEHVKCEEHVKLEEHVKFEEHIKLDEHVKLEEHVKREENVKRVKLEEHVKREENVKRVKLEEPTLTRTLHLANDSIACLVVKLEPSV